MNALAAMQTQIWLIRKSEEFPAKVNEAEQKEAHRRFSSWGNSESPGPAPSSCSPHLHLTDLLVTNTGELKREAL